MSNTIFYKIGSSAPEKNIPPDPCTNLKAIAKGNNIELTWCDPNKITEGSDGSVAVWSYSVLIRKDSGYPTTPEDGVEVCRSSVLNQYETDPYLDPITTRDTTYYYSIFAVSSAGKSSSATSVSIDVPLYRIMTVKINEADSNPATCCSYADDAVSMSSGKDVTEWADFFGYKPCLFKDGQVVGYLNPNDYTKFENGESANITSGKIGDVMVEFPRRGVKISKSGNIITVSMTENPDDPEFTYYAHTRGSTKKDYFYLGSYLAYMSGTNLRSLSKKNPNTDLSLTDARIYAHNCGSGYEIFTFYQWVYLQVMYVLQFKNLNSQSEVGVGIGFGIFPYAAQTGATNTKGMIYGTTLETDQVKLFGIEDLWGNATQIIDGFETTAFWIFMTTTDNFNDTLEGYTNAGSFYHGDREGFISNVAGTSEAGFIAITDNGSGTTRYCDYCYLEAGSCLAIGGPASISTDDNGIFTFACDNHNDDSFFASRLSYY